jgi:2'-5' RNA ligase
LPQTFVPTVQLTHVGRGLQRSQLWAYADNSALLNNIRSQLLPRLAALRFPIPEKTKNDNFVPHIHVANLFNMAGGIGLADYPIPASFMIREIQIIRSEKSSGGTVHHVAGTIPLLQ